MATVGGGGGGSGRWWWRQRFLLSLFLSNFLPLSQNFLLFHEFAYSLCVWNNQHFSRRFRKYPRKVVFATCQVVDVVDYLHFPRRLRSHVAKSWITYLLLLTFGDELDCWRRIIFTFGDVTRSNIAESRK